MKPTIEYISKGKPTMAQLQEKVDGYVQMLPLPDGRQLICNEEARIHNMPPNNKATQLYYNIVIRGNVVVLSDKAKLT